MLHCEPENIQVSTTLSSLSATKSRSSRSVSVCLCLCVRCVRLKLRTNIVCFSWLFLCRFVLPHVKKHLAGLENRTIQKNVSRFTMRLLSCQVNLQNKRKICSLFQVSLMLSLLMLRTIIVFTWMALFSLSLLCYNPDCMPWIPVTYGYLPDHWHVNDWSVYKNMLWEEHWKHKLTGWQHILKAALFSVMM